MKEVKAFPNGLTVRELKALIADWPETDHMGEDSEVWVETSEGLSNVVKKVWPLNSADILFETN